MNKLSVAIAVVALLPSLSPAERAKVKASCIKAGIDLTVVPGYTP